MTVETFLDGRVTLHAGDSREVLKTIPDCSIDSIVTDPPYALVSIVKRFGNTKESDDTKTSARVRSRADGYARLSAGGFMGKKWDTGETAFAADFWAECLRVLKPGGHVVAFSGTRTYHRMACAIEDAGFEVRDMLSWLYGSGFPKSHDVSKGIDRAAGAERTEGAREWSGGSRSSGISHGGEQSGTTSRTIFDTPASLGAIEWQGWGTALKPACEPICFGRKPLIGTVAQNVLKHGTGAINIDACRVGMMTAEEVARSGASTGGYSGGLKPVSWKDEFREPQGRWPANIIHDGSDEVIAAFPETTSGLFNGERSSDKFRSTYGSFKGTAAGETETYGDSGSAARFYYTAKADAHDRIGSKHPTVKPVDLMQWLCRLVTPKGGTVLDPFAGTGTTGEAAFREGMLAVLVEREEEYQADIRRRMGLVLAGPDERARESIKARTAGQPIDAGPLFSG
ncbi:DNA methyltransferase (plasmid) [Bradyrhizobium elkanii]|uniref:DNA-methyltransferase n=1 Tax=Bradyrhizobium elkanii TaxID=29448 RepID=UPI002715405F|nr:DNA methyltransferase [Bradyrhizobium elkanii]WLB14801.1 DNA methyltransferase [Bradyrhizobium elkanii]WLB69109.1 DNA methyltransferase [Bradyrhizobium elkanii]